MKVKNIVFSGFAAAILMGTVQANAAFTIASKDYVDGLVGANGSVSTAVGTLQDVVGDGTLDESFDDETETLTDAVNELKDDVTALGTAVNGKQATLTPGANITIDANNEISARDTTYTAGTGITIDANNNNAIAVNAVNSTTGVQSASSASDTAFPTEKAVAAYVATQIQGVTGGASIGTLPLDPNGNGTTDRYDTVGSALAGMENEIAAKQDVLVAGANGNISGSNGVEVTATGNGNVAIAGTAATDSAVGVMKLYSSTGNSTDGTMTRASITTALADKADASTTYTKTEVNNLLSGKMNVPEDTCTPTIEAGEAAFCVLTVSAVSGHEGELQWAKITAPFTIQ